MRELKRIEEIEWGKREREREIERRSARSVFKRMVVSSVPPLTVLLYCDV